MKSKLNKTKIGIIKALCYSDIFDYPLKQSEVVRYFVGDRTPASIIRRELTSMRQNGEIGFASGFYFILGKKRLVKVRKFREKESEKKMKLAKKTIHLLSFIPTIQMIGISGSLSMNNARREDDIDLFIVTSENSLWITRFLVNFVLVVFGAKRGRLNSRGFDKICPNMFLTSTALAFSDSDCNIYSAHEIAQVIPVVNRKSSYETLVNKNQKWGSKFLPNFFRPIHMIKKLKKNHILSFVDRIFYLIQYRYMKNKITSERVDITSARFHPKDKTNYVEILYASKYKNYINFIKNLTTIRAQSGVYLGSIDTPGY